jgi:ABC-2 type transport system permease protein
MSLWVLFRDELRGFYKSKVMVALWIGLPIITVLFQLWSASTESVFSFTLLSAILVSSIGGTLSSAMLAVSIINEKNRHVYELFLIRPVKRWNIVLTKFLAVYACVTVAGFLAIMMGIGADYIVKGGASETVLKDTVQSLSVSLSMMAVSCSMGVLLGVASPSVLVGVILVLYGGNQISTIPMLPSFLNIPNPNLFTVGLGVAMAAVLLIIAVWVFEKKQF